jgi:hypothetical protein
MKLINAYEWVFPIFAGPSALDPTQIVGSAFPISGQVFVTAGHCLASGMKAGWMALGRLDGQRWLTDGIVEWEIVDGLDLGFLRISKPRPFKSFRWSTDELPMTTEVKTCGFAFGFDSDRRSADIRAFSGHVVSSRTFFRNHARPPVYELSFACPRGLSGAPLLYEIPNDNHYVAGVIIGNEITDMTVFSSTERSREGSETVVLERLESLHLGIALQARGLMTLESSFLGKTLQEHLKRQSDLRS